MRRRVKRTLSIGNARIIARAAVIYELDKGATAPSVMSLIETGAMPPLALISPVSGRKLRKDGKGKPIGPFDYIYVVVSTQPGGGLPPGKRVLVYERPENYKDKGTVVGYADGHAEWVKMAKFKEDLQATEKWLADQAK